jgi:hypothetical protein
MAHRQPLPHQIAWKHQKVSMREVARYRKFDVKQKRSSSSVIETDAAYKLLEPRIGAEGIEAWPQ